MWVRYRLILLLAMGWQAGACSAGSINSIVELPIPKKSVLPSFVRPDVNAEFKAYEYVSGKGGAELRVPFRMHRPDRERSAQENFPLLIWMHGAGESGTDNVSHLRWLELLLESRQARENLFVLAVQLPKAKTVNTDLAAAHGPEEWGGIVAEIGKHAIEVLPIDRNRVYLSGLSMGGNHCWTMAAEEPTFFAAISPMASSGASELGRAKLTDVPIWVFHNADDPSIPIYDVRETVNSIRGLGGNISLTETSSRSGLQKHNCWTVAFTEYGLSDWLMAQRQGDDSPPPGRILMRTKFANLTRAIENYDIWGPRALPVLLVLLLAWAIRREIRAKASIAKKIHT